VVRMFVQSSLHAFAFGKPQRDFANSLTTAVCIIFPVHTSLDQSPNGYQGVCPGHDDNEEAPIGCFVIKDALVNIHIYIHTHLFMFI
jgi:hypothetical protein